MRRPIPVIPPYNPLDRGSLGKSIADALLEREPSPMPPEPFVGAGVYAIYYKGDYHAYAPISGPDEPLKSPIYVGKAVPKGSRVGGVGLGRDPGRALSDRLREHARSIEQASNLHLQDFYCRYLVIEDIWIPLGESLLINKFIPIWNRIISGFGIHQPGGGRLLQKRSDWDVLHQGRRWVAEQAQSNKTEEEVQENLRRFFAGEEAEAVDVIADDEEGTTT